MKKKKPQFDTDELAMSIHTAMRKACSGPDAHALWAAVSDTEDSTWAEAVRTGCEWTELNNYFMLIGGDRRNTADKGPTHNEAAFKAVVKELKKVLDENRVLKEKLAAVERALRGENR